jgi:hypothetical protein
VEYDSQRARRQGNRRVAKTIDDRHSLVVDSALPTIAEFIDHGEITLGVLRPVGCVAIASDEGHTLAMMVRRKDETLSDLLIRLDQAIAKAYSDDVFIDEINPPLPQSKTR